VVADQQWQTRLALASARREVAELDFAAVVADVVDEVPQVKVAALLRTNQSKVSRLAATARQQAVPPGQVARTAYEVAQRYALGELTRERMVEVLSSWAYEPSPAMNLREWDLAPAPEPAGSFEATVGRAHDEGLLSGEDYDAVLDALPE